MPKSPQILIELNRAILGDDLPQEGANRNATKKKIRRSSKKKLANQKKKATTLAKKKIRKKNWQIRKKLKNWQKN